MFETCITCFFLFSSREKHLLGKKWVANIIWKKNSCMQPMKLIKCTKNVKVFSYWEVRRKGNWIYFGFSYSLCVPWFPNMLLMWLPLFPYLIFNGSLIFQMHFSSCSQKQNISSYILITNLPSFIGLHKFRVKSGFIRLQKNCKNSMLWLI